MADIKISALPDASALNGSEMFPVTQDGVPAKSYVSGVLINAEETTKKYTNDINVDVLYPLGSGYYTLATAIAAIPVGSLRKIGATITFQSASGILDRWQYVGTSTSTWTNTTLWINTKENSAIRYAKNNTGATVAKGKLVYISGSTGENPLFLLATNADYATASRTWGMTYDSINNNAVGRIIHFGLIENIDTSLYTVGTELWLDVNGGYTSTRPTSPTTSVYIGMVIRQSSTVGSIFIDLRHIPNLANLSDVKSETYTNGDFLAFNSSTNRFEKVNLYAIEDVLTYGVEWDSAVSSPDGIRIGNSTLHRTLPVHNLMKGVLLDDDGNEVQLLSDNDWTSFDRSGASGQVMVKIPNYYFRCEQDGTRFRFKISITKLAGYNQFFPAEVDYVYCSAYEAVLDRTNLKLASVVNQSQQYRGGNNIASWDGTYRSLLGVPVSNINRMDFRTYARNRNTNTKNWNEYIYTIHVMLSWLFFVEYATLNSQKDYNAALDVNGYKQGGLGKGVSDIPDWGGYNNYNPFAKCGATDSLGNKSGIVNLNVLAADGVSTYYVAQVTRYRGIENPFGHVWKWCDGINIKEDGTTQTAYITTHTSKFSDSVYSGYENRGTICHSEGWVTKMQLDAFGDLLPINVGGSSNTFWCDYYWNNNSANLYGALLGGNALNGASDGFGCVNTLGVPSDADTHIGSRLCFVKIS